MPTIRDIAKLANVSIGTVSRYLNGTMQVKPETAQRINQAVKEMNYVRNYSAASIKTKISNTIALVFPSMQSLMFGEIAEAVSATITNKGYILTTYTTGDALENEIWATEKMREQRIAGAIFITEPIGNKSIDHLLMLEQTGIKTMMINRYFQESDFTSISVNFRTGMDHIVKHLKQEGYQSIGLVTGWPEQNQSQQFIEGIKLATQKYHFPYDPEKIKFMYYKEHLIIARTQELVAAGTDAIVFVSDRSAMEALIAMEELGIRCPQDIALIGVGNTKYAKIRNLSSLDIPLKKLGEEAANTLLATIEGKPYQKYQEIQPNLVARNTIRTNKAATQMGT
jgi:DNA-binding LacI/PurR family transcriptional regulator